MEDLEIPLSSQESFEQGTDVDLRRQPQLGQGFGSSTTTVAPPDATMPPMSGGGDGKPEISFLCENNVMNRTRPTSRILWDPNNREQRRYTTFWWQYKDPNAGANVNWIAWIARSGVESNDAYVVFNTSSPVSDPSSNQGDPPLTLLAADGKVILNFQGLLRKNGLIPRGLDAASSNRPLPTELMTLQASWTKPNKASGVSNSGVFFIQSPGDTLPKDAQFSDQDIKGYDGTTRTPGPGATPTSTQSLLSPTASNDSHGGLQDSPTTQLGSGKGSLSAGAIAGIAVGGVVAVALIGFLVWFFLRRRRPNKGQVYGSQYNATPTAEDKTLATAGVAESRQSGRSEDSGHRGYQPHSSSISPPVAVAYDGRNDQHHPSQDQYGSFASLHDTGASTRGAQIEQHQDAVTDSSREYLPHPNITLPIPHRIRHLVEPQHTNADLPRLLAEEDLLDEAIARRT